LRRVVAGFPPDLSAAVFVVLHLPAWHRSMLPDVLRAAGPLPAEPAASGQPIEPGRIYVAMPDYHLLLNGNGRIQLWRGPREDGHRPSINATFRSIAVGYRKRAIGVILSGTLQDGATGLWWIKSFGGTAIAQDPHDALFPSMPLTALHNVEVDHVVPAAEMGGLITRLVSEKGSKRNRIQETGRHD
jgi:two-component system chemotaxis response regulator CheB